MTAPFFLFAVFCGYGAQNPHVSLSQIHQIHPWAAQIVRASWWHHFLAVGSLPLDRWRWNTAAPPRQRTGRTAGKEDTNIWSRRGQDFLTFSIILLSQANPQSREPEWGSKALFNIVMLYALPYLSWQGAPWLDEGCWKACPAFLIQPHSAKGVISQQCLISVLQTTRAVTEVDVFGFPWLVTGRCGLSAIIITCFGSHVCC